jgi:predicted alpha/beta superfamily hydrolase
MGRLIIEEIAIEELGGHPRKIRIMLPDGYDDPPYRRYPVLYMHDGQNLFDEAEYSGYSWDVMRTLDRMQAQGLTDGLIVVGIDHGGESRIDEYTNALDRHIAWKVSRRLGRLPVPKGSAYAEWIVNRLKPRIDSAYRTLADPGHTGTCGSSCGANISLYLGMAHGDVFGIVGALSPAHYLVADDLYRRIRAGNLDHLRIYHDMGGHEEKNPLGAFILGLSSFKLQHALAKRMDPENLKHVFDPQATHTELFWQDRFPGFVQWAFGSGPLHDAVKGEHA